MNILSMLQKIISFIRPTLDVYTDGSCKKGRGSWAYVILRSGKIIKEASGSSKKTNSLKMETYAVVQALSALPTQTKLRVNSDCRILIDAMVQTTHQRKSNYDRFADLMILSKDRNIEWAWIKAHAGHPMNERVDQMCIAARSKIYIAAPIRHFLR